MLSATLALALAVLNDLPPTAELPLPINATAPPINVTAPINVIALPINVIALPTQAPPIEAPPA